MVLSATVLRKSVLKGRLSAFTLTELLIVLVIIGILVLMALPALMPLISRTRSVEAKQMLTHLQALEKTYFYEHSRYANSLDDRATSVVDFDGDGAFNVWEIDQSQDLVEVTKD